MTETDRKWITAVSGKRLGYVCKDVFTGWAAYVPHNGNWLKIAESKRNPSMARRAIRNWHDLRPDQQAHWAEHP